jgi:hypothetical protein
MSASVGRNSRMWGQLTDWIRSRSVATDGPGDDNEDETEDQRAAEGKNCAGFHVIPNEYCNRTHDFTPPIGTVAVNACAARFFPEQSPDLPAMSQSECPRSGSSTIENSP